MHIEQRCKRKHDINSSTFICHSSEQWIKTNNPRYNKNFHLQGNILLCPNQSYITNQKSEHFCQVRPQQDHPHHCGRSSTSAESSPVERAKSLRLDLSLLFRFLISFDSI